MDPDTTLMEIMIALMDGNVEAAERGKRDLETWLTTGGLTPPLTSGQLIMLIEHAIRGIGR